MKKILILLCGVLWLNTCLGESISDASADKVKVNRAVMDQATMEKIIIESAASHSGGGGLVEFEYHGVKMVVISDIAHDRMRIITPIVPYKEVSEAQINAVMEANFHRALDARYAVRRGMLYAAFIHPLSTLNKHSVEDAMTQVANLALSFGTEYTSGALVFGGGK